MFRYEPVGLRWRFVTERDTGRMHPMYSGDLAQLYDAIYEFKDYAEESRRILGWLRRYQRSSGRDLLDVGCGTGKHLARLSSKYRCWGIDASPHMLRIARRRLVGVPLIRADARTFRMNRQYDAITCLFSVIGYQLTRPALAGTLENLARHLRPGGVLVLEPWVAPRDWKDGTVSVVSSERHGTQIVRASRSWRRGRRSYVEMHHLVAPPRKPIRHLVERHVMGMFSTREILELLRRAGLGPSYRRRGFSSGRGIFVATKPTLETRNQR